MQPLLLLHLPLLRPILHQHLLQLPLMPLRHPRHMPLLQLLLLPMQPLRLRMNMVPPKRLSKMSTDLLRRLFQTDMPHPSLLMQLQQVFRKQ